MKALIFNSGIGSRMGELTRNKLKCMMELYNGETIFERQIRILYTCGITEFIVTVGPYPEQIQEIVTKYPQAQFTFVNNPNYKTTNYIVSMYYAYEYLDDAMLLLHGDLVFNENLIRKLLKDQRKSLCIYNETKELSEKDFKGRIIDNKLREVSISIFDQDCYAFWPLYRLEQLDLMAWKDKVKAYVEAGNVHVYAENALNDILSKLSIEGMSAKEDYIEEIDNKEDYLRVSQEIREYD